MKTCFQLSHKNNCYRLSLRILITIILSCLVSACGAAETMVTHHNLDVTNKTSASVFLDPITSAQKKIYVQVTNTSDQASFNIKPDLEALLQQKGYRITRNPNQAHYLLQANVLQVGKTNPTAAKKALLGGYGSAIAGATIGGTAAAAMGASGEGILASGLVGGVVSTLADNIVKDVTYSVITDIQISEYSKVRLKEQHHANLQQGLNTYTEQTSTNSSHWKRYRTRIVSTAERYNLAFDTARPKLQQSLSQALAGIFP